MPKAPVKTKAKKPTKKTTLTAVKKKATAAKKTPPKVMAKAKKIVESPAEIIMKIWKAKQEQNAQKQNQGFGFQRSDGGANYYGSSKHEKFSRYNAPRRKAS